MNEIIQAVVKLIGDGLNWQETVVCGLAIVTFGFIVWVVITGLVKITDSAIKTAIKAIESILSSFFKGIKNITSSLVSAPNINQPPKV